MTTGRYGYGRQFDAPHIHQAEKPVNKLLFEVGNSPEKLQAVRNRLRWEGQQELLEEFEFEFARR